MHFSNEWLEGNIMEFNLTSKDIKLLCEVAMDADNGRKEAA